MAFRHLSDHDAVVECVLARVGLDGVDQRDPYAVILALGWRVEPLTTHGPEDGHTDGTARRVRVRFSGSDAHVTRVLAHECGHVILIESGHSLPHCECCADQLGRAVCMGRTGIDVLLRSCSPQEIVALYKDVFLPGEVTRRIFEVRSVRAAMGG